MNRGEAFDLIQRIVVGWITQGKHWNALELTVVGRGDGHQDRPLTLPLALLNPV